MTEKESKTIAVLVREQQITNETLKELKESIDKQNDHYEDIQIKVETARNIAKNAETVANETRCVIEDKDTGLKTKITKNTVELNLIKYIGGVFVVIFTSLVTFLLTFRG